MTFSAPILEQLPVPQAATSITAGNEQTCAISGTDQVTCWGGDNQSETPITATGTAVSAGGFTTCATTGVDAFNTTCWGPQPGTNANPVANGQLEMVNWRALAANDQLAIGLANTDTSTIYEFGFDPSADAFMALAPNANYSPYTTAISPTSAQLAVGNRHGCVLFESSAATELTCWGDNEANESATASGPTVTATQVVSPSGGWAPTSQGTVLAASDLHTCAITSTLELACWGSNEGLALGDQPELATPTIIDHPLGGTWLSVATGPNDTCAIDDNQAVYCWGYNEYGEAGNGARFHGDPVRTVGP